MCGITGYIGSGNRDILEKMTNSLRHRGPDEAGFFIEEKVGLGHRRLSIIDLSTGRQPIFNEDESLVIIFNGEIYNFQELKADLEKGGHKFKTNTDTEVIIHLYEDKGPSMLNDLNGMFALAIYDKNKKQLLLARDRLGQKPIYYGEFKGAFIFSSELKSLAATNSLSLSLESLNHFFSFLYFPHDSSPYNEVQKLLPGHSLIVEDGTVTTTRYYELPRSTGACSTSFTICAGLTISAECSTWPNTAKMKAPSATSD